MATLLVVPKQATLLLGSLTSFGLVALMLSQRPRLRWTGLTAGFLLAVFLVVALPQALPLATYAAQPGLLLAAIVGLIVYPILKA